MAVIKAAAVPTSAAPFSMADIETAARKILLRARKQAEELLVQAQIEAEALKSAAVGEGHAEGRAEGLKIGADEGRKAGEQQALNENKVQLTQLMASLTAAATTLNTSRADLEATALQDVVILSLAIAARITKRQSLIEPQVLMANLEEAVKLVNRQSDVRIIVHPSQRATLEAALPQLGLKWPVLAHVEIVDDAALSPGGCKISTRQGQIDADLDAQLNRIAADLLPIPQEGTG